MTHRVIKNNFVDQIEHRHLQTVTDEPEKEIPSMLNKVTKRKTVSASLWCSKQHPLSL
jgi:hypothetical protein